MSRSTPRPPEDKWKATFVWFIIFLGVLVLGISLFLESGRRAWPEIKETLLTQKESISDSPDTDSAESNFVQAKANNEEANVLAPRKVLFWNVRNYFVEGNAMGEKPKSIKERNGVADLIARQQADVVALAEMAGEDSVSDLRRRLEQRGLRYLYTESILGTGGGRGLVLFSQDPVIKNYSRKFVSVGNGRASMIRGILDVELGDKERGSYRVVLVHLKSKYGEEEGDDSMRRAEAAALVQHLKDASGRTNIPFILCGDMNDTPASAPLRAIMAAKYGGRNLVVLRPTDSQDKAWTYHYRKQDQYSRLDYMMVLPAREAPKAPKNKYEAKIVESNSKLFLSDHRPLLLEIK